MVNEMDDQLFDRLIYQEITKFVDQKIEHQVTAPERESNNMKFPLKKGENTFFVSGRVTEVTRDAKKELDGIEYTETEHLDAEITHIAMDGMVSKVVLADDFEGVVDVKLQ